MRTTFVISILFAILFVPNAVIAEPRKDAAETIQEGSVVQWLDYYRRERGLPGADVTQPAPAQTDAEVTKPAPPPPGANAK